MVEKFPQSGAEEPEEGIEEIKAPEGSEGGAEPLEDLEIGAESPEDSESSVESREGFGKRLMSVARRVLEQNSLKLESDAGAFKIKIGRTEPTAAEPEKLNLRGETNLRSGRFSIIGDKTTINVAFEKDFIDLARRAKGKLGKIISSIR